MRLSTALVEEEITRPVAHPRITLHGGGKTPCSAPRVHPPASSSPDLNRQLHPTGRAYAAGQGGAGDEKRRVSRTMAATGY